jgi:ketosteroid isomerase-like protein
LKKPITNPSFGGTCFRTSAEHKKQTDEQKLVPPTQQIQETTRMKLFHSLTAIIALSFLAAPFARTQETETPTEKTSASPAEAAESPTPATPAAPAVEKSPAPTSDKAQASPSSKASSAASPAQKPAAKGSVESQLKAIENTYEAAIQNHNVAAIEPFMAEDFVLTDAEGKVLNRRAALAKFKKDTDTFTSAKNFGMSVHVAAKNVAIVTGGSRETGKDKAGKPFDRTYRWTDTFVDRNGKWMLVAAHVTLVAKK